MTPPSWSSTEPTHTEVRGSVGESLVKLTLQSFEVAVRAKFVREVLAGRSWIALPGARDEVPGVVVWGGRAVVVCDLARFHSPLRPLAMGETRGRVVILETPFGALALPVDHVSEVFRLSEDQLKSCTVHKFELARLELFWGDQVLPLFEPELLFERLNSGT